MSKTYAKAIITTTTVQHAFVELTGDDAKEILQSDNFTTDYFPATNAAGGDITVYYFHPKEHPEDVIGMIAATDIVQVEEKQIINFLH